MTIVIPTLPAAPSRSDTPADFVTKANAFLAALPGFATQVNAAVAYMQNALTAAFFGSSLSTKTPATGSQTFLATTGLAWQVGQSLMIASASAPTNFMTGKVTAYNANTGSLTVTVTAIGGSASKADWVITLVPDGYTPGHIVGTGTNDTAAAGEQGELISSSVVQGAAVPLTTNVPANITSIAITPGDWDVWGDGWFTTTSGATYMEASIGTTSAVRATAPDGGGMATLSATITSTGSTGLTGARKSIVVNANTTVYLVGFTLFSAGAASGFGSLHARRAR